VSRPTSKSSATASSPKASAACASERPELLTGKANSGARKRPVRRTPHGAKIRTYPSCVGVGVGRRGRTETYVECHAGLLRDADAAYLWLLCSAEALGEGGSLDQLIEKSGRALRDRRERGGDRSHRANGDIADKTSTDSVAVLSKRHGVPFCGAAPLSTVSLTTPNGDAISIEERGRAELAGIGDTEMLTVEGPVRHVALELPQHELISGILAEIDVAHAPFTGNCARPGGSGATRSLIRLSFGRVSR
jgi:hypothetical protein